MTDDFRAKQKAVKAAEMTAKCLNSVYLTAKALEAMAEERYGDGAEYCAKATIATVEAVLLANEIGAEMPPWFAHALELPAKSVDAATHGRMYRGDWGHR